MANGNTEILENVKVVMCKGEKGDKGDKGDSGDYVAQQYTSLLNKPTLNGVTIDGTQTSGDFGIVAETDLYGNEFDSKITIPYTSSMSGSAKTFNYTFPSDGYLLVGNGYTDSGAIPVVGFTLTLNGVNNTGAIPLSALLQFSYNVTKTISGDTRTYDTVSNFGKALIPVKKGMSLVGDFYSALKSVTDDFIADFYPLLLNS